MQTETFFGTSDTDMKLGAGDNERNTEIEIEDNILNEIEDRDQFDNTNDSILDDIDEAEESDEDTSEDESTTESKSNADDTAEDIDDESNQEEKMLLIDSDVKITHLENQETVNESNAISENDDTLKVLQSHQSKTNLYSPQRINLKALPERPREYIFLLGPESFIKSVNHLKERNSQSHELPIYPIHSLAILSYERTINYKMETEYMVKINHRIGFIGGGNMARAIYDGLTKKKLVKSNQIFVAGPHIDRLSYFKEKGSHITESNNILVKSCDVIFICVKPYLLSTIAREVNIASIEQWEEKIFVSVLAATSIEKIENCFIKPMKLVRVMPNTPLAVGEGCCVFTPNERVDASNISLIKILLESSGMCLMVPEYHINAMASISGSGPAFMYLIMEALADGGVKMGVPRPDAVKLAAQTMLGAAKMVLHSGKHSAQLKDEVCSAGGTTIAGMHALEKGGVRSAMMDAVEAATKRATEMEK